MTAGPRSLSAVGFASPSRGWTLASNRILATSDGGRTWRTQLRLPGAHFSYLDVLDATHVWVVGAQTVLRTTDGRRWHCASDPCPTIASVAFRTARTGYAVTAGTTERQRERSTHGTLLATFDGGRHWHAVATPHNVQSVCFDTAEQGWLGASGRIYYSHDAGRRWTLITRTVLSRGPIDGAETVRCAGADSAWAEWASGGAAGGQSPHVAFHLQGDRARTVFAERYFPVTGGTRRGSPGEYSGPFATAGREAAVFIDECPACTARVGPAGAHRFTAGTAPLALARPSGKVFGRGREVDQLSRAADVSFVSLTNGWVVGLRIVVGPSARTPADGTYLVLHTADSGRTWTVQYSLR